MPREKHTRRKAVDSLRLDAEGQDKLGIAASLPEPIDSIFYLQGMKDYLSRAGVPTKEVDSHIEYYQEEIGADKERLAEAQQTVIDLTARVARVELYFHPQPAESSKPGERQKRKYTRRVRPGKLEAQAGESAAPTQETGTGAKRYSLPELVTSPEYKGIMPSTAVTAGRIGSKYLQREADGSITEESARRYAEFMSDKTYLSEAIATLGKKLSMTPEGVRQRILAAKVPLINIADESSTRMVYVVKSEDLGVIINKAKYAKKN